MNKLLVRPFWALLFLPAIVLAQTNNYNTLDQPIYSFGVVLPATCRVGTSFMDVSATAGQNLYSCTGTFGQLGTWTLQAGGGGGGSGTVTSVATGCGLVGGTITTSGTISESMQPRKVSGTTDTVLASDCGNSVIYNSASAVAVTLPQAGTTGFPSGFWVALQNEGAGTVTVTPTTSTINGAATLTIAQNQGAVPNSDGTNYHCPMCTALSPNVTITNLAQGAILEGSSPTGVTGTVGTGVMVSAGTAGVSFVGAQTCANGVFTAMSAAAIPTCTPIIYSCGTVAAGGACANTSATGSGHTIVGIATLSGGTSTMTGLSPAFTSSSTFYCVTTDTTTVTNNSKGVPASGSSVTFTGTGSDNVQFLCTGS